VPPTVIVHCASVADYPRRLTTAQPTKRQYAAKHQSYSKRGIYHLIPMEYCSQMAPTARGGGAVRRVGRYLQKSRI